MFNFGNFNINRISHFVSFVGNGLKKKKAIRGKRPQHIQIPKMIDSFSLSHLETIPLPKLRMYLDVIENVNTKKKIREAILNIENRRKRLTRL